MSRVKKDDMTKLRTAEESLETALTAEDEVQLEAVAYLINNAANTGLTRAVYQDKLRPATLSELENKGYSVKYISAADAERQALISWKPEPAAETEPEEPIDDNN